MADLDPETREHLQALCSQITVAHELDPEIQEELYGHMEDKLLAYLSGQERLTEEDAFVLVKTHFGDPAVLKSLLHDAHPQEARTALAQRLAVAFLAFTGAKIAATILQLVLLIPIAGWLKRPERRLNTFVAVSWFVGVPLGCAISAGLWLVLNRWQRRLDEGHRVLVFRLEPKRVICFALALSALVPSVLFQRPPIPGMALEPGQVKAVVYSQFTALEDPLTLVLLCVLWLWWCDKPPRTTKSLVLGGAGWLIWMLLLSPEGWPSGAFALFRPDQTPAPFVTTLLHGHVYGTSWQWCWYFRSLSLSEIVQHFMFALPPQLLTTVIACVLYVAACRTLRDRAANRPGFE